MLGTRFEEYLIFNDKLPFKFATDITITPTTYSSEANWHENIEIQFCTKGYGYVLMDMKKHYISENQIAVVNSNVIHHTNTDDLIKYDCLIIDTKFCSDMNINTSFINFNPITKSEVISKLYHKLRTLYNNTDDIYRIPKLIKTVIEILIELCENHTTLKDSTPPKSFKMIKNTIKYIRENYEKKLSLDIIAKNSLVDKYTLSREFKKATNFTIIQYINGYRCKKAANYISSGMTVSEAAKLCGFTNMSFFTKTFKTHIGAMPHTYKNRID